MSAGRPGSFRALLRGYRIAAGLTQEALAERAGLSVRGIADLERGVRRFPHFHTLRCLAEALELAPDDRVSFVAAGQRQPRFGEHAADTGAGRCRRCEHENASESRFCVECGSPLGVACPACGTFGDPANRFCSECGASRTAGAGVNIDAPRPPIVVRTTPEGVAADGEHKQATVLFCQLADPAALVRSLGHERMLSFLDSFFEQAESEVRRFEGIISSFLNDGFVALFGVPVAHEDHARRGVLAALGLQRALDERSRGMLRVGLNTGMVAVARIGAGVDRRVSAVGETTTVAGLLQQQAEPGAIVIGPATAALVTGYVRLVELGRVPLPGIDGLVETFRVTGMGPRRSPIEGLGARPLSRFVGRDVEMSTLHDVLDQVAVSPELSARRTLSEFIGRDNELAALRGPLAKVEAGQGQVVGVVGEPGIGKSRLVYEFRLPDAERAKLLARQGVHNIVADPIRVVDAEMNDIPQDGKTMGEVVMRGNNVMNGYFDDPDATAVAFAGGWFHSGDIGMMHPDGYIEIRDRKKDIIISGGENISTIEVEHAVCGHPAVLECAVIAIPDEKWGERPKAFVKLAAGQEATERQIMDFCRERIAHFKAPAAVEFGELPKTSTGKVQKYVLREQEWDSQDKRA